MSLPAYVGVAGITTRAEALACLEAFPPCDRLLALGVLVSEKTLAGQTTRWFRRMPPVEEIADIFPDHPRALNLVHYSSSTPPDRGVLAQLSAVGGPRCHGFQFNGAWPAVEDLWALRARWSTSPRIVLQARAWADEEAISLLAQRLKYYRGFATDVLLDASGGRGAPIPLMQARRAVERLIEQGHEIGIVIAGGLCRMTIPAVDDLIREGVSIDAEGLLRDGSDAGGNLVLDEVRQYLEAAAVATRAA